MTSGLVGIGTTSPDQKLVVDGGATTTYLKLVGHSVNSFFGQDSTGLAVFQEGNKPIYFATNNTERARITAAGLVGIGTTSPAAKLESVQGTSGISGWFVAGQFSAANYPMIRLAATALNKYSSIGNDNDGGLHFFVNGSSSVVGTNAAILDSSGNLGLGVTPSAWWAGFDAIQLGTNAPAFLAGRTDNQTQVWVGVNTFFDGSNWKYIASAASSQYAQDAGAHFWFTAASGTAGNTITFTQAMTLDASGDLLVGTTTSRGKLTAKTAELNSGSTDFSTKAFSAEMTISAANKIGTLLAGIDTSTFGVAVGYSFNGTGYDMEFATNDDTSGNPIERARITSGGILLVGTTSVVVSGSERVGVIGTSGIGVKCTGGSNAFAGGFWNDATTGDNSILLFYTETGGTQRGSITYNRAAGLTSYNTTSDVRLKNNIANAADSGDKVDAIKVRQFDWKETGNHVDYGFVAQELVNVAPEAVHQPTDTEKMMAVDYSKLVPMMMKELQSLRKRVAELESK